jgi:type I restriction enzyme, S subunit
MSELASKKRWTRVAFGDVVQLSRDRSADPEADGFDRYVGLDHLEPGDLKIRRWGDIADGTTFTNVFRTGQVLFGKRRAYQRKVAVADFDGVCSGDIYVLEPKSARLLPELLPFLCQTDGFFEHAVGTSAGSLSPRTKWDSLASYEFVLPPLETQHRIASALEECENGLESLRDLSASLNVVRRSAFEKLLSPEANGWATTALGSFFEVTSGGTPSRAKLEYWGGTIPWVKTAEVNYEWITSTEERITPQGLAGSSAKLVPVGSVIMALFGQGPTLGRVARLGIEAATNQACAVVPPNDVQDQAFLFYFLWRQYPRIRAMARGANQPNLNLALVKSLQVPVLPIDDQRRISRSAEAIVGGLSVAQKRLEAFLEFRGAVLQAALREG